MQGNNNKEMVSNNDSKDVDKDSNDGQCSFMLVHVKMDIGVRC